MRIFKMKIMNMKFHRPGSISISDDTPGSACIYRTIIPILLVFLMTLPSSGAEGWYLQRSRPMAMGGAFVALADDENCLVYNPAGLSEIHGMGKFAADMLPIPVSGSALPIPMPAGVSVIPLPTSFGLASTKDLTAISQIYSTLAAGGLDVENAINLIEQFGSFPFKIMIRPSLAYAGSNLGFGLYSRLLEPEIFFRDGAPIPTLGLRVDMEIMGMVGLSVSPTDIEGKGYNPFSVGVNIKYISRYWFDETKTLLDFDTFTDTTVYRETGLSFDLGALVKISDYFMIGGAYYDLLRNFTRNEMDLSINLTSQDLMTEIMNGFTTGTPSRSYSPSILSTLRMGVASYLIKGAGVQLILTADMGYILNFDVDLRKKLHFGTELSLGRTLFLRFGINQGYPTFGFNLDTRLIDINITYFQNEYETDPRDAFGDYDPVSNILLSVALGW